jgi:prevent-host-death family protein
MKKIDAAYFKAHCSAVLRDVQTKRQAVEITKNGGSWVKVIPIKDTESRQRTFRGKG